MFSNHSNTRAWSLLCAILLHLAAPFALSAQQQWIGFSSFRNGDFASSIHAIKPDGTGERRLSPHRGGRPGSMDPSFSPDGAMVYFTRGGGGSHRTAVWSLDPATGAESALTGNVMVRFNQGRAWPSQRPESRQVIYVEESGVQRRMLLTMPGGHQSIDLGQGEFPSWSSDGRQLAFVRKAGATSSIWLLSPGEGPARRLDESDASTSFPGWSPDGMQLVVSRMVGTEYDLFIVDLDGKVVRRLTNTPNREEEAASWSPDGRWISFVATSPNAPNDYEDSIFVMPANGGSEREVTSHRFHDSRPTWFVQPTR